MGIRVALFVFLLLVIGVVPVLAQADCPEIVERALETVDEMCADTGNNQVCYGNVSIEATPQQGVSTFTFERTGDLADLTDVQTLALGGLDEGQGTWGVALMRVRANIPDTLPGQNVTFLLFGDVVLENAVAEQTVLLPVTRQSADVNVRNQPNPDARLIAALVGDQVLYADGRLEDGSWLRVQNPVDDEGNIVASVGWVSTPVVTVDGDINSLPVVQSTDTTITSGYGPMQAFYFRSGIGDSACAEAPDSGLLVQTPEGVEQVSLRVNGVDVQLGSTAYFQAEPSAEMIISTIEGSASVQSEGVTQIVAAGTRVRVGLNEEGIANTPPSDPEPYDADALAALPVVALEREIEIAEPLDPSQIVTLGGDLQATLTWDNDSDMDLSILEPDGNLIWFANRNSTTGGNLDVDSIPCANNLPSVENISWGEGVDIPAGTYTVGVNQFSSCTGDANWTLTVLVGGEVVFTETGTAGQRGITFDYDPATGIDAESITVSNELPQASFFGGDGGFFGNGNTIEMYDNPSSTGELELGQTVSGSFDEGDYDVWTFEGTTGQLVSITMAGDFDTYLELYGPDGQQIMYNDESGTPNTSLISGAFLPSDGTYTIVARSYFESGGDYELTLEEGVVFPEGGTFFGNGNTIDMYDDPSSTDELELGQTVSGSFRNNNYDIWTFNGTSGQVVSVTMTGDFDTYLELYGPDGVQVAYNDDSGSTRMSLISGAVLPSDGVYTIVTHGFGGAGGDYELTLEEGVVQPIVPTYEPPPTPSTVEQGSIERGQTVDAFLDTAERHSWTFEGREGQVVTITMTAAGNGFDTYLELYGANGVMLTYNDDFNGLNSQIDQFELPEDGTYTIVARAYGDFASGDYELTLEVED